jgi:hypothetical protein
MVKTRKTPDQASSVDGDEPVMANPGFVVPDNAEIGNFDNAQNIDRPDSRAKTPDEGVKNNEPENENDSDEGSETNSEDSDSDGGPA